MPSCRTYRNPATATSSESGDDSEPKRRTPTQAALLHRGRGALVQPGEAGARHCQRNNRRSRESKGNRINEALARREIDLIKAGDLGALEDIYASDLVVHYPGETRCRALTP